MPFYCDQFGWKIEERLRELIKEVLKIEGVKTAAAEAESKSYKFTEAKCGTIPGQSDTVSCALFAIEYVRALIQNGEVSQSSFSTSPRYDDILRLMVYSLKLRVCRSLDCVAA